MTRSLRISVLAAGIGILSAAALFPWPAHAEPGWIAELEAVCSRTDAAMTLSGEELADLVARCDRLKERIESEDESTRKISLRRLKSCKDLYLFVLDTRRSE